MGIIWLSMSLVANTAMAEDEEESEAIMERNGVPGFWFERTFALEMLESLREFEILQYEIRVMEHQLSLRTDQLERLRESLSLERETSDRLTTELETAQQRAIEAEQRRDKWYRKPAFLISMGVIITLVLEIGAVFLFAYLAP